MGQSVSSRDFGENLLLRPIRDLNTVRVSGEMALCLFGVLVNV